MPKDQLKQNIYNDEIDLVEYARIIIRGRALIILVTSILAAAGLISSFLKPYMYTATAVVQLGVVEKPVIDTFVLLHQMQGDIFLSAVKQNGSLTPTVRHLREIISAKTLGSNLIEISVRNKDASEAAHICNAMVDTVISKGNAVLSNKIDLLKDEVAKIDQRISGIQKIMSATAGSISSIPGAKHVKEMASLNSIVYENQLMYDKVEHRREILQNYLFYPQYFAMYRATAITCTPFIISIIKNVLVAASIGIPFSLLLIAFQEFLKRNKPGQKQGA